MLIGRKPMGTVAYMGGVPAVLEEFTWSMIQLVQYNQEILCKSTEYVHYDRVKFSDHAPARNELARRFLGDWLFMLDTDHEFEPDILARMLWIMDDADIDVLTAIYLLKRPPHLPVLFMWNEDGKTVQPIANWDDTTVALEIGSAGAGSLLVRRSVFDRIEEELHESPFDRLHGLSEDHSFFNRLRQLEIKAYMAPHVESIHLRVDGVVPSRLDRTAFKSTETIKVGGFA